MATIKQYSINLWRAHRAIMRKLGMDIAWSGPEEKIRAMGTDVMLATLIKLLFDKGLVTDAELNAAYTAVATATFPATVWPEPPGMGEGDPAEPDLGG